MDFFWILLLCCVCSLSRGQGVYGKNFALAPWFAVLDPCVFCASERRNSVATTLCEIMSP